MAMTPTTSLLNAIPWERENPDGTRSATLAGTRDPGVMFTYAFYLPAGCWDAPHSHGTDVHMVVASGELRLTFEDTDDIQKAQSYPPGAFLRVPAGALHADGARTDTVIIGTAIGPWSTTYR
jgi:quercetin dioxygenase-like cupin family protein